MNIQTAIIADDFTGAGDSSIHFCHAGFSVFMPISLQNAVLPEDLEVLAVNTESRLDNGALAYQKTVEAVKRCQAWGATSFYKKIDSTLRGNIHDEIKAVIDAGRYTATIICPAAPDIGRTVVNGRCLLHGAPINETETGQDHLNPVKSSYVKDLFEALPETQIAHIATHETELGVEHLSKLVEKFLAEGVTHIICDATTNSQLAILATLISNNRLLLTGAAGLAAAIAQRPPAQYHNHSNAEFSAGNILISSGSRMEVSRIQLTQLEATHTCTKILVPTQALAANDQLAIDQFWNQIKTIHPAQNSCYILTPDSSQEAACTDGPRDNSEKIAALIAEATAYICQTQGISVLISIGGHTTYQLVKKLQATGVSYEGEVLPGTPFGNLQLKTPAEKLSLITKSGSFGDARTLQRIYEFITAHMNKLSSSVHHI